MERDTVVSACVSAKRALMYSHTAPLARHVAPVLLHLKLLFWTNLNISLSIPSGTLRDARSKAPPAATEIQPGGSTGSPVSASSSSRRVSLSLSLSFDERLTLSFVYPQLDRLAVCVVVWNVDGTVGAVPGFLFGSVPGALEGIDGFCELKEYNGKPRKDRSGEDGGKKRCHSEQVAGKPFSPSSDWLERKSIRSLLR